MVSIVAAVVREAPRRQRQPLRVEAAEARGEAPVAVGADAQALGLEVEALLEREHELAARPPVERRSYRVEERVRRDVVVDAVGRDEERRVAERVVAVRVGVGVGAPLEDRGGEAAAAARYRGRVPVAVRRRERDGARVAVRRQDVGAERRREQARRADAGAQLRELHGDGRMLEKVVAEQQRAAPDLQADVGDGRREAVRERDGRFLRTLPRRLEVAVGVDDDALVLCCLLFLPAKRRHAVALRELQVHVAEHVVAVFIAHGLPCRSLSFRELRPP